MSWYQAGHQSSASSPAGTKAYIVIGGDSQQLETTTLVNFSKSQKTNPLYPTYSLIAEKAIGSTSTWR